jgi:asparagine synthase (glutamine-hydrolysing)
VSVSAQDAAFIGTFDPRGAPPSVDLAARLDAAAGGVTEQDGGFALTTTGPVRRTVDGVLALAGRLAEGGLPTGPLERPSELLNLRGAFAIATWSTAARRGFVARDQLGAMPTYYAEEDGVLLFATELRRLLGVLRRRPAPSRAGVAMWITVRAVPSGETLYKGIRRLPPGHALILDGGWRVERYWTPARRRLAVASAVEGGAMVRDGIRQAVERTMRDARQPAVMMSGGLDSTAIAVTARDVRAGASPLETWSAAFPDYPEANELEDIGRVLATGGLDGRVTEVRRPRVLGGLVDYVEAWQLPCPSPNYFYTSRLVEEAAGHGVDVMLDGEGGDEIFGLTPYLLADHVRRARLRSAWQLLPLLTSHKSRPGLREVRWQLRQFVVKGLSPAWVDDALRRRRGTIGIPVPEFLTPDAAALLRDLPSPLLGWKHLRGPRAWASMAWRLTEEGEWLGVNEFPYHRGRSGGLDERHPFLHDVDLVELMLALPPNLAFDPRHDRPLLREAMRGLLPEPVRLRTEKTIFNAMIYTGLRGPDWPGVEALLGDPQAEIGAYVDLDEVRRDLLERPPDRLTGHWATGLWQLLTAEVWLRAQHGPGFADELRERFALAPPDVTVRPALAS